MQDVQLNQNNEKNEQPKKLREKNGSAMGTY